MSLDERLIAYVDGELPPAERARLEAEIAADPGLAARLARHRALADGVSAAYATVLEEPIPPRLTAAASAANDRAVRAHPARFAPWAAAAAALVVGVVAGRVVGPTSATLVAQDGSLTAQGRLDRALDLQLAADPGPVKIGLTFRTADGRVCRTFESGPDRLAGLACRAGGRWTARTVTAWSPEPQGAYRQAASETPPELLAAVDSLIAGEPLDAAAERAARDRGWK